MMRKNWKTVLLKTLVYIFLTLLSLLMLFPIYVSIISSFKTEVAALDGNLFPALDTLSFDNYVQVFTAVPFGRYLKNTLFVSGTITVVSLFFDSMAGYALAKLRFRGNKLVFSLILSTMMIPGVSILVPLFVITRELGLVNTIWGVIIPSIPKAYGIFMFRQFFLGVPNEIIESGKIDGASLFGIYWRLVIPVAKNAFIVMAIWQFLINWNAYTWPLIVTSDPEHWLIQIGIASFKTAYQSNWNLTLTGATVASVPVVLVFIFLQRYMAKGISTTGIKG